MGEDAVTVGVDQIGVYLPRYVLSLDVLAAARKVPTEKIHLGLGAYKMAITAPWEDAVTLGANAAARLFAQGQVSPDEIGLLLVATETAVDHAKPVSIFLHELPTLASNFDAWASMSCEEPSCNCQQNCQQTADLVKLGNDSPKLR